MNIFREAKILLVDDESDLINSMYSFLKTNCQIKCNTYGKKPKSSSIGVLYFIHFLGLLFIKLKL